MGKPFKRTFSDPAGSKRARDATTKANRERKAFKVVLAAQRLRLLGLVLDWECMMTELLDELDANAREMRKCDAGLDAWKRMGKQPARPYREMKPMKVPDTKGKELEYEFKVEMAGAGNR